MNSTFNRYWPWFFFTAAFQSLIAIVALVVVPSEGGFSLARIGLFGVLLLFLIAGGTLGFMAGRNPARFAALPLPLFIYSSALLALTSGLLLFLLRYLDPEQLIPYFVRLSPLLWYLAIVGSQAVIFLLLIKNGFHGRELSKQKSTYRSSLIVFLILLAILTFIAATKIGLKPDTAYWGEPGVAIQGWQLLLSVLVGFIVLLHGLTGANVDSSRIFTFFIPVALYILAAVLWLSVPMKVLENSFYAPITPPANMPFPYSDAGFYDYLSQSLLIGTDYLGGIPPRPLYVLFLAILHFFLGQNYPAIITAQTLLLALFPVVLYFLGKKIHSPAAGVTAALLAIFRELVGLWISSNTRVVNSRIFTTDFPTALALAVLSLVVIWWLERRDLRSTLIAGGSFGLLLLFRTQSFFTLPIVLLFAWWVYRRKTKEWILACAAFLLASIFTVMPWLAHNHTVAGRFSFDDPRQMAVIYSQYAFTGNLDLSQFDPEKESLGGRLVGFTLENPGYVSNFIAAHFLNTEIGGLLALPLIKPFNGLLEPVNLYWVGWDGTLEWYNLILILIYLVGLSVGLGTAWNRLGWIGLVPLAFNLGYAFANGISRFSSWRYNLPVDWALYFYFAVGVIEILKNISFLFGYRTHPASPVNTSKTFTWRDFRNTPVLLLLVFAFIGSLPWIAKGLTSPRYTSTPAELLGRLEAGGFLRQDLESFMAQPQAALIEGRMLYPRMYRRDLGVASANPWPAYAVREYARIGFVLLNDRQHQALFITRDLLDFPQGADAIMLGCSREGYVEARLVLFDGGAYQSAPLSDPCD